MCPHLDKLRLVELYGCTPYFRVSFPPVVYLMTLSRRDAYWLVTFSLRVQVRRLYVGVYLNYSGWFKRLYD